MLFRSARDEAGRVAEVVFHPVINFAEAPSAPAAGGGSNTAGTPANQPPADSRDAAATDAKIISGGLSGQPAAGGERSEKAVGPGADAGAALKISPAAAQVTGFPVARVESEGVTPAAVRDDARLFVYQGMTDLSFTGRGSISFSVPLDAFAHADPTAIVELQARLADGSALPAWLNFNAETGSFTGSPAGAYGHFDILIIARDAKGAQQVVKHLKDLVQ